MLRELCAANPSPMTLDGTRTWLVGAREMAIIDPGPSLPAHVQAITGAVAGARVAAILLTHEHSDHAEAAAELAVALHAPVRGLARGTLRGGDEIRTDSGDLIAVHTPGHTPDHAAFHWPARRVVFCGDLMMGGLDSALVAPPDGNLAAYLASLERLRALEPALILPAHGPDIHDPAAAIDTYIAHRHARLRQVLDALAAGPRSTAQVAESVYGGTIPAALRAVAAGAAQAYLEHLERTGRACREGEQWRVLAVRAG